VRLAVKYKLFFKILAPAAAYLNLKYKGGYFKLLSQQPKQTGSCGY